MKKFMKAIAFVTVMCMALSTVAFAADNVPETADTDKTFIVNVTEAGANEQVALMVVEAGDTNFNKPLYIDQKGVVNGTASFKAVLTNASVDAVDVYVGYASKELVNEKVPKLGTVKLTQPVTEVTISNVETTIVSAQGQQQIGAGVAIKFDVEAPENTIATDMIWAIRYLDENGDEQVKYTDPFKVDGYGIGKTLTKGIQLSLAFLNGFTVKGEVKIKEYEIKKVDAIFLFSDGEEVLTNEDDWNNEDPNNKF